MNKFFIYISGILLIFSQKVYAVESVTSELKQALKHSYDMNYISIIGSLLFVVFLIYITGVIYAKLNVLGTKTLKNQFKGFEDTKVIVHSTTPLGNNKSLNVIEIAGKKLLIGVTPESINLIKDLDEKIIQKPPVNLNKKELVSDVNLDKLYPINSEIVEENVEFTSEIKPEQDEEDVNPEYSSEEFGLYKKYL